jgi:hypothetical protein
MDALISYVKKRVMNALDIEEKPKSLGRMILCRCILYVEGKARKELKLLPLQQTPVDYLAGICDDVSIVIDYCYSKDTKTYYRYRYDPNEEIAFPFHPQVVDKVEVHPIRVYAWVHQTIPIDVTQQWNHWEGPGLDFHGKGVPIHHIVDIDSSDQQVYLFIMLNDGSKHVIDSTVAGELVWPYEPLRPCSPEEWMLVEKLSQMSQEQCTAFFEQLYGIAEDSEFESEESESDQPEVISGNESENNE